MRLPGIVQVGRHVRGYGLLGFDGALFEGLVVLIRSNSGVVGLILEHLNFRRSILLSSLPSVYLVRRVMGIHIVSIKHLFALLIEEVLKVFMCRIQIEPLLHFMEVNSGFRHR